MRLDSNLSRPQNPNRNSAAGRGSAEEGEARNSRYVYDRLAAARRNQGADAAASSPPGASALCYANSLDFANFFCSDAVESDDDAEHAAVNSKADDDADMLTLTRSLAFGGSIDTDEDQHEGRMISIATTSTLEPSNAAALALWPQLQGTRAQLLIDPQTCGPLMAALPKQQAGPCMSAMKDAGFAQAAIIGTVQSQEQF